MNAPAPPPLPEQFGRYRIEKQLGQGGMGSVYLAHDTQLDRKVALKVPHFTEGKGPQIIARFYQEARAAATIHHPHVCPIYDVGEIDGIHYLTMAFVEGKPLEDWLERDLSLRQIATLGRKIADALNEAHKKGVIHRDLKPANIMIDKRGEPIVMDFGLARRTAGEEDNRLTQAGTVLGSPAYMSPEQIRGEVDKTGSSTDIFSLGVILYELIARRLPFDGATVGAVHAQILLDEPPPLHDVRDDSDPALDAICMKALEKKAENRYRSMQELATTLKSYLEGKAPDAAKPAAPANPAFVPPPTKPHSGIHASDLGFGRSMVVAQQEDREHHRPKQGSKIKRKKKRAKSSAQPWVLAGVGVVTVAVIAVLAAAFWPSKKHEHPTTDATAESPAVQPQPLALAQRDPKPAPDPSFTPLFNGKDLGGWEIEIGKPGVNPWKVDNGELSFRATDAATMNGWLMTERDYGEFILRLDFKMEAGANSAVSFRNPPHVQRHLCANIEDNTSPIYAKKDALEQTGSLFSVRLDRKAELNPVDSWNSMEITVLGRWLLVAVNGKETTRVELDDPAIKKFLGHDVPPTGRIGLNCGSGVVHFRNIAIKEYRSAPAPGPVVAKNPPAPDPVQPNKNPRPAPTVQRLPEPVVPPDAKFEPLFDGKNFNGWKVNSKALWSVNNGDIVAKGAFNPREDWIETTRDFSDYILRMEFQTALGSMGGVMPRLGPQIMGPLLIPVMDDKSSKFGNLRKIGGGLLSTGGAAWLLPTQLPGSSMGALQTLSAQSPADLKPHGQWNKLEIKVRGPWFWVSVNGNPTLGSEKNGIIGSGTLVRSGPKSGRIGLLALFATTRYRKVEIYELPKSIFNGVDLNGWSVSENPNHPNPWRVEAGELVASNEQRGDDKGKATYYSPIHTKDDYSNYRLTFDFQASRGGLCYFGPRLMNGPGYNIPIMDDSFSFANFLDTKSPATHFTGAFHPLRLDRKADLKPQGEWNRMEVEMNWPNIKVLVNGKATFDSSTDPNFFTTIAPRLTTPLGKSSQIRFTSVYGMVRFRNLELVELPGDKP